MADGAHPLRLPRLGYITVVVRFRALAHGEPPLDAVPVPLPLDTATCTRMIITSDPLISGLRRDAH